MSRYKIWNGEDVIYTLGAPYKYSPEQWKVKYPWCEVTPCVISGEGAINGSICMPYADMLSIYAKQGCDFSECTTEQEHLDAIEAFEDLRNTPTGESTAEERIAAAMEYQILQDMMSETEA